MISEHADAAVILAIVGSSEGLPFSPLAGRRPTRVRRIERRAARWSRAS